MYGNKIVILSSYLLSILVFGLINLAAVSTAYAELPDITAAELIKKVKAADSLQKNYSCKYSVFEQLSKDYLAHVPKEINLKEKRTLEFEWRREGIRSYVDFTFYDGALIRGKPVRIIQAFNGENRIMWTPYENKGDIFKDDLQPAGPFPIDFGMTLQDVDRNKKLGDSLAECKITTVKQEKWQEHECYFAEVIKQIGHKAEVWIDPKCGWRARSLKLYTADGRIIYESSAQLKDYGDGQWFPVTGVAKIYWVNATTGKNVVSCEKRLKVEQAQVNAKLTKEDFEIKFPPGTSMYDHISNTGYTMGVNYPPLSGKPLPDMRELAIALDPNRTNDKMILTCFFDIEQRPSRNCIMQLSTKAQELKAKEVIVLAIQASKIEQGKLDEWIKENNVGFPVGMIESDEEKTCFNWGVKSLPWLILTDKRHTVIAEGFSVNEIDEKIESK